MGHAMRKIHRKDGDCCPADGRSSDEDWALPTKVTRPLVTARVEKPDLLATARIDAGQVGTFVVVVRQASEGQIGGDCVAAMLFGYDMVDLKASRGESLRQPAILTGVACASPHENRKGLIHSVYEARWGFFWSACRALE